MLFIMFVLIFDLLDGSVIRRKSMNKVILTIGYSIQNLFREKINITNMLLVLIIILTLWTHIESSNDRYHLYANTLNALGIGFGKKFDLFDGSELDHELTTQEILIRQQSKKWHLRDLFR